MKQRFRGKRVLIVEDEFVTGELLRSWVEGAGGIPVGPALTGEAAVELASHEAPHAALLDVSLLDGSSVGVARHLDACGVPYAVVTGHSANALPQELKKAPYLEKPFTAAALETILEGLLAQ